MTRPAFPRFEAAASKPQRTDTNMCGSILAGIISLQLNDAPLLTRCNVGSIDKTSSAELSEAINSMYKWYEQADICYAYLSDIATAERTARAETMAFKNSKWFTRGWTLQELIAPRSVEFYARDWTDLGTKSSRQDEISIVTGIDVRILDGEDPAICNVAERLSWAATRTTTRIEDAAYCLLGLFQVHMPLLYGEGERALIRLQEEILKTTEDYTLLARGADNFIHGIKSRNALASTLSEFNILSANGLRYSDLVLDEHTWTDAFLLRQSSLPLERLKDAADVTPTLTAKGLHICLPLLEDSSGGFHAYLYCSSNVDGELLCISLRRDQSEAPEANRFERMCSGIRDYRTPYFLPATVIESFILREIFIHQKREAAPSLLPPPPSKVILEASATMGFLHSQNCSISTSWGSSAQSLPWKAEAMRMHPLHVRVLFHFTDLDSGGDFMVAFGRKAGKYWCGILLQDELSLNVASHEELDPWDAWKQYEHFVPIRFVDRATRIASIGVVNVSIRKITSGVIVKVHIDDRSSIAELPSDPDL
jgi:hypothetical protein